MNYLKWVAPGWSYYGAGTTQVKLNAGFISWGLMDTLTAPIAPTAIFRALYRLGMAISRKLYL
jgi:hypothetical protein